MSERSKPTVRELPFGDEARKRVARQIVQARRTDRASREKLSQAERQYRSLAFIAGLRARPEKGWENDRPGYKYINALDGLEATFQHVRGLESNLVLDVGTGMSQGISDIAKSELGTGLEFKGTSVTPQPEFKDYLGKDKVIITSAESLRGIENNSVGAILALHSISYSAVPQHLVARLDQVLVEGGVVKLMANPDEINNNRLGEKEVKHFDQAFKNLGYDVEILGTVLLAVKPFKDNSKHSVRAKDLMEQDRESIEEWKAKLTLQKGEGK